ncbi:MAG: Gfo/Idh/MocA family oxidoreductase [Planctomycetes bacterium]|nr:Gfo/Idh/MocA family oxidoreductase [Planctomycetota bacterium]
MKRRMSRRRFLSRTASVGAGWWILADGRSAWGYPANEKLNLALVGAGKRGNHFLNAIPKTGQNLAAVCDVDLKRAQDFAGKLGGVPAYQDFRRLLDEKERRIDGVIVATPDNTHAVIAAAAMKRGKHVYCEKPIAHDVAEARALRHIARERKVATQMGNQGMASDSFRRTLELVEAGAAGEIREVHLWFVFGGSGPLARPQETPSAPEHLQWDLWIGPAPFRPYHPSYFEGWGAWRDFSTGCVGGGGSHSIHMAFKALKIGALWEGGEAKGTIRIEAETSERCPENFPRWAFLRFDIPARGPLPPARLHWYNASEEELRKRGVWERLERIAGRSLEWKEGWTPRSGTLLVGSKGVVHTNAHNSLCALLPERDFPDSGGPPRTLPATAGHEEEWFRACKGGPQALSGFDHSGPAIELLLAGNVATWAGRPIELDPLASKVVNDEEADRVLRRQYRQGWSL